MKLWLRSPQGYISGTSCPYQIYPVSHRVRKRSIEIFVFSPLTSNIQHPTSVFSLGEYSTVMKSKPSFAGYNGSDHIIYSKHFNTKSDVYAIPVERIANISNEPDIFDYSSWFASQSWQVGDPINPYGEMNITGGSEITDPAQRTEYANMNFNPYKKKLENGPVIRYLYTGREYNMETGDYYYRMRMMDSSVGGFSGKDILACGRTSGYYYVANSPLAFKDSTGMVLEPLNPLDNEMPEPVFGDESSYLSNWSSGAECSDYFRNTCGMTLAELNKKMKYRITTHDSIMGDATVHNSPGVILLSLTNPEKIRNISIFGGYRNKKFTTREKES